MAMTSERRSTYSLCGAKKKNGETCRQFAGAGTDHKGTGACRWHLGNTEAHRKHATKVQTQREAAVLGETLDIAPHAALRAVLGITAGAVAWLKAQVGALDGLESPEAQTLVHLYQDERDRLTRVAKVCVDAGMRQAEIEVTEQQTAQMGQFLQAVMDRLELTPTQRKQVGPAIRATIPTLSAGSAEPDAPAVEPVLA